MNFTLLILARNELQAMKVVMPRINKQWVDEILVVDGGSTDGTIEYAESLGCRVYRQKSKGVLGGFIEGMLEAKGDVLVTFTPDNNMIPEKIPELVAKMREGYDMVICSRYLRGAKSDDDNVVTGFGNWLFTTLVNVLFRTEYTDVLGFYRAYIKDLLKELGLDISNVRLSIDTQLCIRCKKFGKRVIEIPGDEPPRIGGKSSRSIIINGVIELYTIVEEFVRPSLWRRPNI
jgi:glycosyltransferase involved in cell wall biosynthesis